MSSIVFAGEMQERINLWMTDLDEKISQNCSDYSYFGSVLETQLRDLVAECGAECFIRLAQATITELGEDGRSADQVDVLSCWLIFYYFRIEKTFPNVNKMVRMLHLHLDSVNARDPANVRVRNICMLLSIMCQIIYTTKADLEALFTDELASFLVEVVQRNSNYTLLYALMCFGPFSVVDKLKHNLSNQESLRLRLQQLSSGTEKLNLESVYNRDQSYVLRFRIGECAQWLFDHLFGSDKQTKTPNQDCAIKLLTANKFVNLNKVTRDNYSAFGFDHMWQNYQCSEGIDPQSGDVFYYEAILLTQGSFHVGWTLKMDLEAYYGFKDLMSSIAFDPYEKRIKVKGVKEYYHELPPIKPCDVVGCLLDTGAGTFKFFLNGYEIPHTWVLPEHKLDLSTGLYYPTACLSAYQQVYFNFGQAPFRFAPSGVKLSTICEEEVNNAPEVVDTEKVETEEKVESEEIVESEKNWKHFLSNVSNRGVYLPALSKDTVESEQEKFNEWMIKFNWSVLKNVTDGKVMGEELKESLHELVKSDEDWIKLARTMITKMGISVDDQVDVMAMWIMSYIKLLQPPSPDKVLQLVQPYLESYIKETSEVSNTVSNQLLNICILLSIMPQVYQDKLETFVTLDIITPLMKLLSPTNEHKSSKLYALYCMQSLANSCQLMKGLLKSLIKSEEFEKFFPDQLTKPTSNSCDFDLCQINFMFVWLLDYVFDYVIDSGDSESFESSTSTQTSTSTSTNDDHAFAKGSHDHGLEIIGHYHYDWIDYEYQKGIDVQPVLGSVYFFEAIPMTSGSARVGWALSDRYRTAYSPCSSIFFDAYQKCIYIDDNPHPIEAPLKQPKPGTVIGCLLDITSRTFAFYLDGDLVPFPKTELWLSAQPYIPTVALAAYQHVYLNFGNDPFKYPPKEIQPQISEKNEILSFELVLGLFVCLFACFIYLYFSFLFN